MSGAADGAAPALPPLPASPLHRFTAHVYAAADMHAYALAALAFREASTAPLTEGRELASRLRSIGRSDVLNALVEDKKRLRLSERDAIESAQEVAMKAAKLIDAALASPQVAPAKVYLVATGEVVDGMETYTRHEGAPPPLCDSELLFATPVQVAPPKLTHEQINDEARRIKRTDDSWESLPEIRLAQWAYARGIEAAFAAAPVAPQDDARDAADPFTAEEKAADPQLYLHPEQFERRDDGKVVRKDRWEIGIRNAWTVLGGVREPFEIEDVVDAVRRLAKALPETSRPLTKAERAMLCFVESLANDFSAEDWRLHGFSPKTYDNLKRKLSVL